MEYRGVYINCQEIMPGKGVPVGALTYQDTTGFVSGKRPIYSAASNCGSAFALSPQQALDDVKVLIDRRLGR